MSTQPLILVIDDEQQILRAMRTILGQQSYRVITAASGEHAGCDRFGSGTARYGWGGGLPAPAPQGGRRGTRC